MEQYIENNLPGIPKLEAIKRRRTDNTMAKKKVKKTNNDLQNFTHKLKIEQHEPHSNITVNCYKMSPRA